MGTRHKWGANVHILKKSIDSYKTLLGTDKIDALYQMASLMKGVNIVHINSTKEGGGVAEILSNMVPLMERFGLNVKWHVIQGNPLFFQCTKKFHNLLQGEKGTPLPSTLFQIYEETNKKNAALLEKTLQEADVVFIHDPQPLSLIAHFPHRKGIWIWRCHIDLSNPAEDIWTFLKPFADLYDRTIFSMEEFAQKLSFPSSIIAPSIDPLSEKNIELEPHEIKTILAQLQIDKPYILQVSRFDRFKDPLGVIEAYRLAKIKHANIELVLAGGGATDDPEETQVLQETKKKAHGDPNIHIRVLPSNAHRTINALQRGADIILQKSLKEGFGLTVSEALWKSKPVIGGNTGGIRLQIIDGKTGFLVTSPQEAADRIEHCFQNPTLALECGVRGKERVKERFLITRELHDYLDVIRDLHK